MERPDAGTLLPIYFFTHPLKRELVDYVKGENLTVTGLLIEAFGLLQRQREPLRMPASDSPTADFGASLRARPDGQTPRAGRPPEGRMSPPLAKDYMRMTDDVPSWRARKSL